MDDDDFIKLIEANPATLSPELAEHMFEFFYNFYSQAITIFSQT